MYMDYGHILHPPHRYSIYTALVSLGTIKTLYSAQLVIRRAGLKPAEHIRVYTYVHAYS